MDGVRPACGDGGALGESVALPDGARVLTLEEQAEALARDTSQWVRRKNREMVCWEAVRLQVGRGRIQRDVAVEFGVSETILSWHKKKDNWRLMSAAELEALSRVLRLAFARRRALLMPDVDPKTYETADKKALAWTPVEPDDEMERKRAQRRGTAVVRVHEAEARTPVTPPWRVKPEPEPEVESARGADLPWADIAHAAQLAPEIPWRTWMLMGGRGAGKTRAGAEWVRSLVEAGLAKRIALVGPSLHDVREVMIAGPSGLCAIGPAALRPTYEVSRRRLVWPDKGACKGAVAYTFSAEDPDSLRGPQFDAAWCDEIGAWANDVRTWKTLAFAMRLGAAPRIVATTTPRPRALVKLLADKAETGRGGVVLTQASTRVNAQNLAPEFVAALEEDYGGTELGRQEIDGALVEDLEGAMWTRAMIERTRCLPDDAEGLERVVVAVDPPVSAGGRADACGIVVAGVKRGVVYVLSDATVRGLRPAEWAKRVAWAAEAHGAGMIVAESNQGGELVRDVLQAAGEGRVRVKMEAAVRSKKERAQPVSALYEQGRVKHVRVLKELEDEMCSFGVEGAAPRSRSPDRVDALVWAVSELTRKPPVKPGVSVL